MTRFAAYALALLCALTVMPARAGGSSPFQIDASVGLSALVAVADGHFGALADALETVAGTPEARSLNWESVKPLMRNVAAANVSGVTWYAKADGTYWTLASGLMPRTIADRAYFKRVLGGKTDIGELVTSRSTNRAVAVVAVPVFDANQRVVAVAGSSVYLDDLSNRIASELGLAPPLIFWAVDGNGQIALHGDVSSIFMKPAEQSPQLARVMADMIAHDSGTDTYEFRGKMRTVIYRKSSLNGWRYGLGIVR